MPKKVSKKKIIVNVVVAICFAALAAYYLTKSKTITIDSLKKIEFYDYLIVAAFALCYFLILALIDYLIYRTFTLSMTYKKCICNVLLGNLGSSVTPFRSGHFPLMAYYQNGAGVSLSDTLTGFTKCQIVYSVTSIIVYSIIVIVLAATGITIEAERTTVALWLVVFLGLSFHLVVFVAVVLLAYIPKLQKAAVTLWAKVLKILKRIDSVEGYVAQKADKLALYKEQMNIILKRFYKYIPVCFLYVIFMFLSCSAQYLSFLLLSGNSFSFKDASVFYVLCLASTYIGNVIPVPGGVGTAEVLFTLVYSTVISQSLIGSVLILWRFSTYYVFVLAEVVLLFFALFVQKKSGRNDKTQPDLK